MKKIISVLIIIVFCQACTVTRAFMYWGPNITDHKIFPYVELTPGDSVFRFHEGNKEVLKNHTIPVYSKEASDTIRMNLDDYLRQRTRTTAFLVIRNDSILFEKYYRGYTRDSISAIFSVSKSVTSLLTGIAVDEGYIENVHDPVTKYVPELKKKDPKFERLTIEHLLNMRAGFKFNENNLFPTSKATRIYYGTNILGTIKKLKFEYEPGEKFSYQSIVTALLAIVVERATGRNLAEYLQEKVWLPLGMENGATWSIDDKQHRTAKGFCGLNATVTDLAKIGRLYLNNGSWNGKQIVSANWVAKSTTPTNDYNDNYYYRYQWLSYGFYVKDHSTGSFYFSDSLKARQFAEEKHPDYGFIEIKQWKPTNNKQRWTAYVYPKQNQYRAFGIMGQIIFVDPQKNLIIVRLGEGDDMGYSGFTSSLAKSL